MNNTRQPLTCDCHVVGVKPLNTHTFEVVLQAPAGLRLDYHAGQYLNLALEINDKAHCLSYSIANRCDTKYPQQLRLFIQNASDFSHGVILQLQQALASQATVKATVGMGQAYLQTDLYLPHLLVAAGSGISQIKAIAEDIVAKQPQAQVNLYWSNKNASDFYLLEHFQDLADKFQNLSFTPIIEIAGPDGFARSGYIFNVIQEDFGDLSATQAYFCGSTQMVYGILDALKEQGLKEANCYSDVFAYAPRQQKLAI